MRIVSLLPSLTELVCALGHRAELVGVTHECDFPPGVETLPHLTRSRIPQTATSAEIDNLVAEQGGLLYDLDADLLASLRPDLVLTQSQCDVCAVNEGAVRRSALALPNSPVVESVNPTDWPGVSAMFGRIGELLGDRNAGEALARRVEEAGEGVRSPGSAVRVALLEWFDPPFAAGHWIPDLLAMAGGVEVLGKAGEPSRRIAWDEVSAADPDVLLLSPCGFSLERSDQELSALVSRPEWRGLRAVREGRVSLVDGSAYFSRPGPRLLESVQIARAALDPARNGHLAPPGGWRQLATIA